jgi:hypothetical protein
LLGGHHFQLLPLSTWTNYEQCNENILFAVAWHLAGLFAVLGPARRRRHRGRPFREQAAARAGVEQGQDPEAVPRDVARPHGRAAGGRRARLRRRDLVARQKGTRHGKAHGDEAGHYRHPAALNRERHLEDTIMICTGKMLD